MEELSKTTTAATSILLLSFAVFGHLQTSKDNEQETSPDTVSLYPACEDNQLDESPCIKTMLTSFNENTRKLEKQEPINKDELSPQRAPNFHAN